MKDFYKILGVKENASEEEIRERWIELTKHYHPDLGEGMASDERIREINEAYQVLKHSSTRVEYDLTRTYSHGERESKRGSYLKKRWVPVSILIIFLILGVIYFYRVQISPTSQLIVLHKTDQGNKVNQRNQRDQINLSRLPRGESVRGEMRSLFHRDQTDQKNRIAASTYPPMPASAHQPIATSTSVAPTHPHMAASTQSAPPRRDTVVAKSPRDTMPQTSKDLVVPTRRTVQTDSTNSKDSVPPSTQNPRDAVVLATPIIITPQKVEQPRQLPSAVAQSPYDLMIHQPTHSISPIHHKIEVAQFKLPALMATEEEVKKFFDNYVNYYNRKDARNILSLFSSKAIQNQKGGLDEIRRIYADFFNQGQEVRYNIQDMKIEIYQNAVEVKAHYEIEQISKTTDEKEVWRGPIRWVLIKEDGKLKILSMDYKYHPPPAKKEESNEAS